MKAVFALGWIRWQIQEGCFHYRLSCFALCNNCFPLLFPLSAFMLVMRNVQYSRWRYSPNANANHQYSRRWNQLRHFFTFPAVEWVSAPVHLYVCNFRGFPTLTLWEKMHKNIKKSINLSAFPISWELPNIDLASVLLCQLKEPDHVFISC